MKVVPNVVYNHLFDENPKKALVMSFHGWTGTGKNFVSNLIAEYAYKKGMSSAFVHTKLATNNYPESGNIEGYKKDLKKFIITQSKTCGRSLFIFDEMDKMPAGLLDELKSFIDFHPHVEGVDYRKNIFIFLNNIGGEQINNVAIQNVRDGNAREDISTSAMEYILSLTSLKLHGGLKNSSLILSGLVDFFVPFLPMERLHVKQCASVEIKRRFENHNLILDIEKHQEIINKVADEIQFYPEGENIYSISGCKQVMKKVDIYA